MTTGLNNNQYRLVATNSAGTATSTAATLTVSTASSAPTITTQPTNQTVTTGRMRHLRSPPPARRRRPTNGRSPPAAGAFTNLTNGAPYSGVTTATLTITAATAGLSGNQYRAVATNSAGSATSNGATLTVTSAASLYVRNVDYWIE